MLFQNGGYFLDTKEALIFALRVAKTIPENHGAIAFCVQGSENENHPLYFPNSGCFKDLAGTKSITRNRPAVSLLHCVSLCYLLDGLIEAEESVECIDLIVRIEQPLKRAAEILEITFPDLLGKLPECVKNVYDYLIEQKKESEKKNKEKFFNEIAIKPQKIKYPTDKLSRDVFTMGIINGEETELYFSSKKLKEETIFYSLSYDEIEKDKAVELSSGSRLTAFEESVHDAVCTLYECGNEYITDGQIYDLMTGCAGKQPSQKQLEQIRKAMKQLNSVIADVNAVLEHDKFYGFSDKSKFKFSSRIVQYESVEVTSSNKKTVTAYHILSDPPLFSYAKAKKQIGNYDPKLLQVPDITNTSENIILKNYIIKRVEASINGNQSTTILLKTMYEKIGCDTDKKKRIIRANAERIFYYLKSLGYLKTYKIEKKGNSVYSYKFTV